MSPLVFLGALGTVLSSIAMFPHLVHAFRARKPAGTAFAWGLSGTTAVVWLTYGVMSGEFFVAAPGLITVPANFILAAWCARHARAPQWPVIPGLVLAPTPSEDDAPRYVLEGWADFANNSAGDTLEMPRIVG